MSDSKIKCPNCGTSINVNDILAHQLKEELQKEYSSQLSDQKKQFALKEEELLKQKSAFELKRKNQNELFQEKLDQKVKEERPEIEAKLKQKILAEREEEVKLLQKELNEKSEKVIELNKSKAEIESLKREKSELAGKIEAEAQKKLTEELKKEAEKIKKLAEEENRQKLLQLQKQLDDQKKLTEDMKRKQEQGSMQLQGEVQELAIEDELRTSFPFDRIEEVSKGIRGADCIQTVINKSQEECGKIIYESKRTTSYGGDWIAKLKSDMLSAGADIAVLITQTLPKDQKSFNLVNGVWVCSFTEFKSLALALRENIIKISATRNANENKGDKMYMLYDYLTGNEFRHQLEAIFEGFNSLQSELDREKRAMQRIWKEREKQIQKVLNNTIDLYGSVKGIAGSSVKSIDSLELDNPTEVEDEDQ